MASSSYLNLGESKYKKVQLDFLTWAANWVRNGVEPETASLDLPDVVNLLQALGFRIRNVGGKQTQPLSPLRGGEHGLKVMVSCTHSVQTCILEQPKIKEDCRCVVEQKNETSDAIWEITATTQEATQGLVETGCDIIPAMPKEHSLVMKHVLNYLLKMIRQKKIDAHTAALGQRNEPFDDDLQKFASPTRYRSLDTLTSKDGDIGLPEPGSLKSKVIPEMPPITVSSPNLKLAASVEAFDVMKTKKTILYVRNLIDGLLNDFNSIENQTKFPRSISASAVFEDKVASKSTKNFNCFKPPPSTTNLSREKSPTLSVKSIISLPKSRLRKSDSYTLEAPQQAKSRVRMSLDEKMAIPKPEGVFRRTDKYAHVKSTIPKATEARDVNKKK